VHPLTTLASNPYLTPIAVTLGYTGLCWVRPFGTCRTCRPAKRRPRGRPYCRACSNTRLRLRTGRRVWNFIHRLYTESTR
jgi:hypothetical protein